MIIYGTMLCPDCVQCCQELDAANTTYEFRDITKDLAFMKEFLKIRDEEALFSPVKEYGKIGIPCIVHADGRIALQW